MSKNEQLSQDTVSPMEPSEKDTAAVRAAASRLGSLAKGKPKHYSPEEIARRTERLKLARFRKITKT